MGNTKYLIAIVGPTASGKTAVAIQLAQQYNTAILSADSRQFYKELNIGVARPTEQQLQAAPHYFIADRSIENPLSAGQFEKEALQLLEQLFVKHDVVVLVGGSGLFINTLVFGADPMPEADEAIRATLQKQFDEEGIPYLQRELQRLDPVFFAQVDQQNPLRMMRAIEVCLITGQPYSAQRKNTAKERPFETIFIGIDPPREQLYAQINHRVDIMVAEGLEDEAKRMLPYKNQSALQTVGYSEWFDFFEGKTTREEAIDLIKRNSRRYAKRQMTWFRRNDKIKWFEKPDGETINDYLKSLTPQPPLH